jgi:putative membrane protein
MPIKKEHVVLLALAALFITFLYYEYSFFEPHIEEPHMAHHREMHSIMAGRQGLSLLGFNLLFWILLFVLIYLLFRKAPQSCEEEKTALTILKERYARGEINRNEYLEKFRDIKKGT